ncbi:MAG: phosphate ABC transporter substrate-binding protein, partial [Gammaproteobacteria bacterium]|nr:phosphate ABC transporter substrate-binding protein [Gammaproteobacteria bacterium]
FAFINDEWPALVERVKTIGHSQETCGLPLVAPFSEKNNPDSADITDQLNQALSRLSKKHRKSLHLTGFESVTLDDYQSIIDLETLAKQAGYAELA